MAVNDVMEQNINYEVFVEGNRYLGTALVDLPEINYMTNEIKGAGVAGQIDMPTLGHVEDMEVTLHWRSIFERPTGLLGQNSTLISLRGAMQKYDAATGVLRPLPVRIDVRAIAAGLTLGKLEPSEQTDTESKFKIDYIKITIDGVKEFEHDLFNYVHEVEGYDYLSATRAALGL